MPRSSLTMRDTPGCLTTRVMPFSLPWGASGSPTPFTPCQERRGRMVCRALHRSRHARVGMNSVTTATALPSWCRPHGQHGRKCEAQPDFWSRTHKQLEAWLWLRPRITGGSTEKRAIVRSMSEILRGIHNERHSRRCGVLLTGKVCFFSCKFT
jgi:hypothetical protein